MRVDIPTLRCDRCGTTTQDLSEMGRFQKLSHSHMSGTDEWDLCPACWAVFAKFMKGTEGDRPVICLNCGHPIVKRHGVWVHIPGHSMRCAIPEASCIAEPYIEPEGTDQ